MKPYWLHRNEGEALWMVDVLDTIKAGADQTGNSFALVETSNSQGTGPPLHVHDRFDRGLYVLEGEYTVVVGDDSLVAKLARGFSCRGRFHTPGDAIRRKDGSWLCSCPGISMASSGRWASPLRTAANCRRGASRTSNNCRTWPRSTG